MNRKYALNEQMVFQTYRLMRISFYVNHKLNEIMKANTANKNYKGRGKKILNLLFKQFWSDKDKKRLLNIIKG